MLIPVLDTAGKQIAWIDRVNLEVGGLFKIGASTFSLRDNGALQEVEVRRLGRASLIAMAANDAEQHLHAGARSIASHLNALILRV